MYVVVCGPPGVGKTSVATRLRDALAERGHQFRLLHSDDFSRRTYERMFERVRDSSDDWLLDGTFYRERWQARFRELDDVYFVRLTASLSTCLERNRRRASPIDERGVEWRAESETGRVESETGRAESETGRGDEDVSGR